MNTGPGGGGAGGGGAGDGDGEGDGDGDGASIDRRRHVAEYFRLQRWEIPATGGAEGFSEFGGRAPLDRHLRNAAGGLRTGALLTSLDSLGGLLSGLSVHPRWIVTTSIAATVARLDHAGPLRLQGRILRRGRNSVVSGLDVVDEGAADRPVAAATMTCAVLDPGDRELHFERPYSTAMPSPRPEPPTPEDFFCIEPGSGPVTTLRLADHLRNPWGILHGGAVATLAEVAACRSVEERGSAGPLAAGDTVLHYLRPNRVGPVVARCEVLGGGPQRALVRVAVSDLGQDGRLTALGSVAVLTV
ncbi:MAG: PaaI family thioesterase [Acidimicrobiales bacterium]